MLAGALSNVELGDEIPAELYKAVAEVLIFVLRLSSRRVESISNKLFTRAIVLPRCHRHLRAPSQTVFGCSP